MPTYTLRPSECSEEQLDAFESLVILGGEVPGEKLGRWIRAAEWLGFQTETDEDGNDRIVGVGALKNPNLDYKLKVFGRTKADAPDDPHDYRFELGWFYILEDYRHQGISKKLRNVLLRRAGTAGIYATSKENNVYMHLCLQSRAFVRTGCPYRSDRGNFNLVLFVRN